MSDQITTAAELDGLPDGTVMRDCHGDLAEIGTESWGRVVWKDGWSTIPDAIKYLAPLTVLYRPDVPPVIPDQDLGKPSMEDLAAEIRLAFRSAYNVGVDDPAEAAARAVLALIPPQRCAPSKAALSAVLIGCLGRDDYLSETVRAITKLYGDQPTVAQAKVEALREMGKWFRLASQLGTGERDEIAAQACFDRAAAIESGAEHG